MTLPDGSEFSRANPQRTAMMRYRAEQGNRAGPLTWVPRSRISPALRRAVIIAEDANFYHHKGIDWDAAWNALQRDWRERRFSRGGSTITQQLAKNLYLDPRKTIWRKGTEALIALRMERHLSKPRLLELYLNVVEWGRGVYGAEAAADQGYGWQYIYLFFRNQGEAKRFGIDQDYLDSVAGGIEELNEPEWLEYLEGEGGPDGAIQRRLQGYEELGRNLGIRTGQAAIVSGPNGTRTLQDGPSLAEIEAAIAAVS